LIFSSSQHVPLMVFLSLFCLQYFLKVSQFGAVERCRQKFIAVSFALISGPERAIFFRFFVRLEKTVGEFFLPPFG